MATFHKIFKVTKVRNSLCDDFALKESRKRSGSVSVVSSYSSTTESIFNSSVLSGSSNSQISSQLSEDGEDLVGDEAAPVLLPDALSEKTWVSSASGGEPIANKIHFHRIEDRSLLGKRKRSSSVSSLSSTNSVNNDVNFKRVNASANKTQPSLSTTTSTASS